jgi:protein-disulfide isomerase
MTHIDKRHYFIGAALLAFAFAVQPFTFYLSQKYIAPKVIPQPGAVAEVDVKGLEMPASEVRHLKGDANAKIYLVEFIDYECYYCNMFHSAISNILSKNNGKVAIVHKSFPLSSIHPHAMNAAIASECVAKLAGNDNFWKYTDTLILNNKTFSDDYFKQEALKLGVNPTNYATCMADAAIKDLVDQDQAIGSSLGVQGTPFTLIVKNEGGKLVVVDSVNGSQSEAVVQALVEKYLAE